MEDWLYPNATEEEIVKSYGRCEGFGVVLWLFITAAVTIGTIIGAIVYHYLT